MSISPAKLLRAARVGFRAMMDSLQEKPVDPAPEGESGTCTNYWTIFEGGVSDALAADRAGNPAARDRALDEARQTKNAASAAGCDWAQF